MSSPKDNADLRHMTSHTALLSPTSPPRPPQQLSSLSPNSSRPGSRSPSSIPSSPTSIHSSSSAIFERDIELLPSASTSPHLPPNPHRTPRSKTTEHIEQSVPSVLSEAATILTTPSDNDIAVIAPAVAPVPMSFSQAASVGSRSPRRSTSPSPSPTSRNITLPSVNANPVCGITSTPARPSVTTRRTSSGPMPPGAFVNGPSISPTTPTTNVSPVPSPTTAVSTLPPANSFPDTATSSCAPTAPSPSYTRPTPTEHTSSAHQKRLSFVSYSDILSSTPITSLPLSSLTSPPSGASPPHLPAVNAAASLPASPSRPLSTGAPSRPLSTYSISTTGNGGRAGGLGLEHLGPTRRNPDDSVGKRLKDDIGGEWEREGFGKGLEERLEELMAGGA